MDAENARGSAPNPVTVERTSERELVVTRTVAGPAHIVFAAWTRPELFRQWWAPRSFGVTILSCELDVRTGGTYRLEMGRPSSDRTMAFFGRYLDVVPNARIVWTNDEGGEGGAVTTVTFEQKGDATLVVIHDLYPSKQALDEAIACGSTSGWDEQFGQLDGLIASGARS